MAGGKDPANGSLGWTNGAKGGWSSQRDALTIGRHFNAGFNPKMTQVPQGRPTFANPNHWQWRKPDAMRSAVPVGLGPLMQDILNLHDTIYAGFENAYKEARDGKAKLGKRQGIEQKLHNLPLTGIEVNYVIPSGLIFPLLASLRALIGYDKTGNAYWESDAIRFFEKYGGELVATLIEQLEMLGGNPQTAGKKKPVYTALHDRARLLLSDEMNS